jgi:ubiquinone/menaquinone biosynthesis C-methylase UbiE
MKNIIQQKPADTVVGRLKKILEFVDKADIESKVVLDIGCGYGWFEKLAFKYRVKKIIGIEITDNDLATARKYIKDKRFTAKIGSGIAIPLKDQSVNTVVAWEVIEHIPKNTENVMFSEVNRVLKPNGLFYLSTPYKHVISTALDPAFWLVGHRHYSMRKLITLGLRHGFIIEDVSITGKIWTSLSVLNMYVSKWIFRKPLVFNKFFGEKVNKEYFAEGYYNIFIKYRKVDTVVS